MFLPTYEDCVALVQARGELVFYETKSFIAGYQVSVFNYRLAGYNDFITPIPGSPIDAREMRGITFVFKADGSLYRRFLMLRKFWNINQVPETQYEVVKDYPIKSIYNKEDGSLVSFYELPDGTILPKTKVGLDNEQVEEVKILYAANSDLQGFVKECLDRDWAPMFEYVSFKNRIVLNYNTSALILLRVRENQTGAYIDLDAIDTHGLQIAPQEPRMSLEEVMTLAETVEDKEGWVLEFMTPTGPELGKHKTMWYWNRHNLLTNDINREDAVIALILDNTLDDVIVQLHPVNDAEKLAFIAKIEEVVKNFLPTKKADVDALLAAYTGDMKTFALAYHKHPNFHLASKVLKGNDPYEVVKEFLRKKTYHLLDARAFVATGTLS